MIQPASVTHGWFSSSEEAFGLKNMIYDDGIQLYKFFSSLEPQKNVYVKYGQTINTQNADRAKYYKVLYYTISLSDTVQILLTCVRQMGREMVSCVKINNSLGTQKISKKSRLVRAAKENVKIP